MTSICLIAKHLNRKNLKIPIIKIDTICSFTGKNIKEAVSNKDLIKKTFTDHSHVKYNSGYSSIDAALCIEAVLKTEKGFNSLRSYSYLVTEKELILLKREQLIENLLNPPNSPFVFAATYSNKKHTSYKTMINFDSTGYQVMTDAGGVLVSLADARRIHPIIQSWYTVTGDTKAKPTMFTKADILTGCDNMKKIHQYGVEKHFKEDALIQEYRDTAFLKLLVHALNKKNND